MKPPNSDVQEPSSAAAATPPSGKKVIVKSSDMLPEIQKKAIDTTISINPSLFQRFFFPKNLIFFAFEKHSMEKDVVEHMKKEFNASSAETLGRLPLKLLGRTHFVWVGSEDVLSDGGALGTVGGGW
ncbi:dynein light chain [Fagus crenata]